MSDGDGEAVKADEAVAAEVPIVEEALADPPAAAATPVPAVQPRTQSSCRAPAVWSVLPGAVTFEAQRMIQDSN
jgi:hypothetical protein